MTNYGTLQTLLAYLVAAPSLVGVSVVFGEENIRSSAHKLPVVTVVPVGGPWVAGGGAYYRAANVNLNALWMTQESIDLYLWSADVDGDGRAKDDAQPIDHANAVENLRARVLQAFQTQQAQENAEGEAQYGWMYRPVSGRWETQQDESNRYGRTYVLTVQVDITVPDALPVEADVDEVVIDPIEITG